MESGANAGNLKAVESAGKFATGLTFAPHWLKSEQRRCDWLEHVSYPKQNSCIISRDCYLLHVLPLFHRFKGFPIPCFHLTVYCRHFLQHQVTDFS